MGLKIGILKKIVGWAIYREHMTPTTPTALLFDHLHHHLKIKQQELFDAE